MSDMTKLDEAKAWAREWRATLELPRYAEKVRRAAEEIGGYVARFDASGRWPTSWNAWETRRALGFLRREARAASRSE